MILTTASHLACCCAGRAEKQFSRKRIDQRKHDAVVSQQRRYPDDWVFNLVEGDGQTFQWGMDYTNAGSSST